MYYEDGTPLERYAKVNNFMMLTRRKECISVNYNYLVKYMKNVNFDSGPGHAGIRQWSYQTCTELGYYQTTDIREQIFGHLFSLDFYVRQCKVIFGEQFKATNIQKGIKETNANYVGYKMKGTRNVFPNGSIDPWHAVSFTHSPAPGMPVIYILGTFHCANMYPSRAIDSPELKKARQEIDRLVAQWLAVPH